MLRIETVSDGKQSRNASAFVALANSEQSKFERKRALAQWLVSNEYNVPSLERPEGSRRGAAFDYEKVFELADIAVNQIRSGKLDAFDSANRMVSFLTEHNKSASTIINARTSLLKFLRYSRLGLDADDLHETVKSVHRTWRQPTKLPSRELVKELLLTAPLKTKVLISILISTGARIGEVRRLKVADVDFNTQPAYVYFRRTKTERSRIAFLSTETVSLLRTYLGTRPCRRTYVFDGGSFGEGQLGQSSLDKPLAHSSAWEAISRAFQRFHIEQKYDGVHYVYHPHMFRMLCLAILKTCGYPADWAEHYIGHSLGTIRTFLPTTEILAKEWRKLDSEFCFLNSQSVRQEMKDDSIITPPQTRNSFNGGEPRTLNLQRAETERDENIRTKKWANKSSFFIKTSIHSPEYDEALAGGYTICDSNRSLRVLQKPKTMRSRSA
jgi:integrase